MKQRVSNCLQSLNVEIANLACLFPSSVLCLKSRSVTLVISAGSSSDRKAGGPSRRDLTIENVSHGAPIMTPQTTPGFISERIFR